MQADLYTSGFIINYPEADISLERDKIVHRDDIEDRSHLIKQGDNLPGISYKYYGTPLHWYLIADVNNIDNPFILEEGTSIIIPNIKRYDI